MKNAKRGQYLEVPGGPLLSNYTSLSSWKQAVSLMKETAEREGCAFVRIRPQTLDTPKMNDLLHSVGFRPAPMHLHAELTRVLDLTKTDEQLRGEMRKTTRYEIRRAERLGIRPELSQDEKLIDDFMRLQAETAKREEFVPFSRKYLLEQFRAFKKEGSILWFLVRTVLPPAEGQSFASGKIISMAYVIFYRKEAVYHYAASNAAGRTIPAAYAIQWAIIQEAKKRGCKNYNLWGDVSNDRLDSHRFAGPSLFKRGFGGEQTAYLRTHDLPFSWRYWINWGIENLRKKFRSL